MFEEKYFLKNNQYFLEEFQFKNGFIIENAKVDYGIVGTPKYDDEGNIINAILFCHNFNGNYSTLSSVNQASEEIFVLKDEYFFISITSLGIPESCCPSTSGLNNNFPDYEIEDLVNFQRQFISEKFPNIKKLKAIIGYSFGGFIALGWSIFYPDEMDCIIQLDSSFKSQGYKYIYASLANRIIDQSSEHLDDMYNESISKMLILISQIRYLMSFPRDYLNSVSNEEIDLSIDTFAEEILFLDIYDMKFLNNFLMSFNLESELDRIKCKVLIISLNRTNYYVPEFDAIPLHEMVEGSEYLSFDLSFASDTENIHNIVVVIKKFVDSV
ncbi:alpha/beta fold hydrolase [Methanobrevibacter sp.]|uniref:alpha/beta fold hydrolase n=1 Tax=Methanobrevibacter sp. TaxID=66852 RepID=UPI00388EB5F1